MALGARGRCGLLPARDFACPMIVCAIYSIINIAGARLNNGAVDCLTQFSVNDLSIRGFDF